MDAETETPVNMRVLEVFSLLLTIPLHFFTNASSAGRLVHSHAVFRNIDATPDIDYDVHVLSSRQASARDAPLLVPNRRTILNMSPMQTTSDHGWVIKYRRITSMIIPVQVAASVLEDFLTQSLKRVQKKMAGPKINLRTAFTINIGSVFLSFKCDDDQVLAWRAVEIIVQMLLDQVNMGWASEVKMEWFHAETGKRLWVSLSMMRRIGPGPGGLSEVPT